jgi:hypothetical protein
MKKTPTKTPKTMNNFWTNLFNYRKTYLKPTKPKKPTPTWNQSEQIRISKLISRLNRHKYRIVQHRKAQLNKPHA